MTESGNTEDFGGQEGANRLFGEQPESSPSTPIESDTAFRNSLQQQRPPRIESQSTKNEESVTPSVKGRNDLVSLENEPPALENQSEESDLLKVVGAAAVVAGAQFG